jgi:hypothetical protein
LFELHFNFVLLSKPRSYKWFLFLKFPHLNYLGIYLFFFAHTFHVPYPFNTFQAQRLIKHFAVLLSF